MVLPHRKPLFTRAAVAGIKHSHLTVEPVEVKRSSHARRAGTDDNTGSLSFATSERLVRFIINSRFHIWELTVDGVFLEILPFPYLSSYFYG